MSEGGDLPGDRGEHRRVGMAKGIDRNARQQVEVAVAVGVPDVTALTADEDALGWAERVHHRMRVLIEHRARGARVGRPRQVSTRDDRIGRSHNLVWRSRGHDLAPTIGSPSGAGPNSPLASSCGGMPSSREKTRLPRRMRPSWVTMVPMPALVKIS